MRIRIGDRSYRIEKCDQLTTWGRLPVLTLVAQIESHLQKEMTRCARASQKTVCENVTPIILSDRKKMSNRNGGYCQ